MLKHGFLLPKRNNICLPYIYIYTYVLTSRGDRGCMVIGWKADLFEVQNVESGIYSLSVNLSNRDWFFRGGSLVSMDLQRIVVKRNSGLSLRILPI